MKVASKFGLTSIDLSAAFRANVGTIRLLFVESMSILTGLWSWLFARGLGNNNNIKNEENTQVRLDTTDVIPP